MGLEYRGSRVSHNQDIIRLLDARAKVNDITTPADSEAVVSSGVSGLANKSYVDSVFSNYATQADVDSAFSNKLQSSALGSSLLQLDSNGLIPPSALPELSTRGAKWVAGGSVTTQMDIGSGGLFGNTVQLSSVYVNGASLMGNRPYWVMGFAQIECKGNFGNSNPVVYISTSATAWGNEIATGHGIPGWIDYYHITVIPTADASLTTFTGNRTFYLTCKSFNDASSDFTNYLPSWGLLLVPVSNYA